MASLLDRISSSFAEDVVSIYNVSNEQVFENSFPMKASVSRYSNQFEHPLEDSTVITDHRVIMPVEISLIMIIPNGIYKDVYRNIRKSFNDADILEVRTKADTFSNMIIQAMPHEENPEKFDAIDIILELKETQFETINITTLPFNNVVDKTQSDSVNRGEQNSESNESLAVRALNAIVDAINR